MCKKVCLFPREKIYHVLVDHMNLEDPLTLKCAICVRRGNSQKKFLDFESLRAHFLNSSGHPRPEDFINNLSCTYTGSTEHVFPTGYKQIFRTYEWHFTKCFIG
uniref:C2H2-type domain-containing protein n=1 Tax=Parastrongyloides trichosuri TaxID=131310 RepID=A0A0N4ZB66_PARTI